MRKPRIGRVCVSSDPTSSGKIFPQTTGSTFTLPPPPRPALTLADAPPFYHSAKPLKPILPHDRGRFVPNPGRSPLLIWPVGLTAHPPRATNPTSTRIRACPCLGFTPAVDSKIGSSPEGALCRRRPPQLPDPTN